MKMPVNRVFISRGFKNTGIKKHFGLDLAWNKEDDKHQPVYACDDGLVIYNRKQTKGGYTIIIKHTNGLCSVYGHLKADSQLVREKDKIKKGQQIANVGNSGLGCIGYHLHFAIYKGTKVDFNKKVYLDPLKYINVYKNQEVGKTTAKNYKLLYTKEAKGITNPPLLFHNEPNYKATTVVKGMGINNGDEVETYGLSHNGTSVLNIVDNVRHYYCSNTYLKDRT